ncbi:MAG TPA: alkaline phosphatase family protein [Anaerohalosphaeraceae bacterium]|nr:alkaline phosphatase family protein [Anaerohalosphaeraceae bacterium]
MHRSLLLIGIDGGTWTVLEPAIQAGCMPFLKSIRDRGVWGVLKSTIPAITPAAWGAFQTGKNPGASGVYDFYCWSAKERKEYPVNSQYLGKTIWQRFSEAGLTCGVLNVPMTYPPRPIRGVVVSGLLTPSLDSDFTYPADFKQELLQAVPDYDILTFKKLQKEKITQKTIHNFVNQMAQTVWVRTRAAKFIIRSRNPDVMMVHFQSSDVIQHGLWHFISPDCPEYDPSLQQYVFEKYYRILDSSIAEIVQEFYPSQLDRGGVFLLSDHGFTRHRMRFNMGNWLVQQGYLRICSARILGLPVSELAQRIRLGRILGFLLPPIWHRKVLSRFYPRPVCVDWDCSRVYATGYCNEGFLFVLENDPLKKEMICKTVVEKLLEVNDPATGGKVIEKVYRKEEVFQGAYLDQMPDLVVCPCSGYSITGGYQYEKTLFEPVRLKTDFHLGKHHPDGFFVAAGEGLIRSGGGQANLLDIAPTLLAYMGVPIPSDMDGQVRQEWFEPSFLQRNPIQRIQEEPMEPKGEQEVYSPQEAEKVKKRLEELGYL